MRKLSSYLIAAVAALGLSAAYAQDDDGLEDLEMDVMEADETPNEASTRILTLPDEASDQARDSAAFGLETANEAREGGAEFGESVAEQAREGQGDFGRDTAEDASGGNAGGPPEEQPGPPEDTPGGP